MPKTETNSRHPALAAATLTELLTVLRERGMPGYGDGYGSTDNSACELPTFGGDDLDGDARLHGRTVPVWSWDETWALVSLDGGSDYHIVQRSDLE